MTEIHLATRIPTRGGDEYDAFSARARRIVVFHKDERHEAKRSYRRRFRRLVREALRVSEPAEE